MDLNDTISELRALLEGFEAIAQPYIDTTPTLLIHPYASRPSHEKLEALDAMHSRISSLNLRLGSLKTRVQTMETMLFRQQCWCASAVPPIFSLPPELLSKVFTLAQKDDIYVARSLACVSSQWRRVAMQERSLWGRVKIPTDRLGLIQSPTSLTPFIDGPIHAVFTPPRRSGRMAPQVASALLRRLVTANIQSAQEIGVLERIAGCVGDESFHALEELRFDIRDAYPGDPAGERPIPVYAYEFGSMPRLRTLTMKHCFLVMTRPTSITALTITSVDTEAEDFWDVLLRCHRLVNLKFDRIMLSNPTRRSCVLLSELRSLEVTRTRECGVGVLLSLIEAPALRTLMMPRTVVSETVAQGFEDGRHTNDGRIFREFNRLINNSPDLEVLDISSNKFGLNQYVKLLLPHREGFIDIDHGTCPLPHLSELDISLVPADHDLRETPDLINNARVMLEKHRAQFGLLKRLTISSCVDSKLDADRMAEAVAIKDCDRCIP